MHSKMASWVWQVNDATGFLKRLYEGLKDTSQRDRATGAGTFARNRSKRMTRKPSATPRPWVGLQSDSAERIAWRFTVQGLLGLNILVALGDASEDRQKAGPLHDQLNQELAIAVKGFVTAFPSEFVEADLDRICEEVIDDAAEVANAVWRDIDRDQAEGAHPGTFLKEEWLASLRPTLREMVHSV